MKVYNKRGNLAYKERRVVAQIEEAIAKKLKENPNFQFEPANSLEELQSLHSKMCIDDVAFTEIPHPKPPKNEESISREGVPEVPKSEPTEATESTENVADPFNRDEAFVRGYVKGTDFPGDKVENLNPNATFGEPQTSKSAFEMPPENSDEQPGNSAKSPKNENKSNEPKTSQAKIVNPNTSEASPSEKRKNTKKMAKVIVLLVTGLWQKGMLYWSTSSVNENELRRLHQSGEIDMLAKLQLPDGDEQDIVDFFMSQNIAIENAIEITQDERDRLTESLTAVMVKKGIEPTDEQMLLLDVIEVFGIKSLAVYGIKTQLDGVLEQLKVQNSLISRGHEPEAPITSTSTENVVPETNLEVITEK